MAIQHTAQQFIRTKYMSATCRNGARIAAICDARRIYLPWQHQLSSTDNHRVACEKLAGMMAWGNDWLGASDAAGNCVWVSTSASAS